MPPRFVRASKYRHVYGQSTKKEQCYDNLRISKNAWDTNLVKANPDYLAVNWEAGGGGSFAVIPLEERGKLPERLPLFRGHTAAVLDTDWNPFNDSLIASASDDGKVFLWRVPDNFTLHTDADEPRDIPPVGRLAGHSRKVGHVLFNPSAANVLASASGDFTVKVWDIEQSKDRLVLKHGDVIQSLSWSANGALLVTTCRDKKFRVWDVRMEKPAIEVAGHLGAKNSRAVWMGEQDRVATTGFSKMSDRQLGLWDIKVPNQPIGGFKFLDSISGVCMPFWDAGNKILYLAGKGDGNIRYYEYENDKFEYLTEYKSADPQRGVAFMPKRGVNVHENEVARAFKTCNDSYVEPISFIVPRRSEDFQTDIYPPTVGTKPAMSAGDWFDGKTAIPPRISLKGRFDGGEADEVPAPAAKPEPAAPKPAAAAEPPAAKPTLPVPAAEARAATSDVEEDDEDDDEDDEDEPEPLLADRANAASAKRSLPSPTTQPPPRATPTSAAPPPATKPTPAPAPAAKPSSATPTTTTGLWSASREAPAEPKKSFAALAPEASATAAQAQDVIAQALNGMQLAQQQAATAAERDAELVLKMLAALSEQVRGLTSNVDTLVGAVRRVELEIESLHEERG